MLGDNYKTSSGRSMKVTGLICGQLESKSEIGVYLLGKFEDDFTPGTWDLQCREAFGNLEHNLILEGK